MDHVEKDKRPKGIMIWKCHHSFGDGISSGSLLLAISKEYDRSYFLSSKDAPWTVRILARVLAPFQIPTIIKNSFLAKPDFNYFTNKRQNKQLSGNLNCCTSDYDIPVNEIKALSKYKGITINDVIMASLSTALKKVFEEQGEKVD